LALAGLLSPSSFLVFSFRQLASADAVAFNSNLITAATGYVGFYLPLSLKFSQRLAKQSCKFLSAYKHENYNVLNLPFLKPCSSLAAKSAFSQALKSLKSLLSPTIKQMIS
jgi:hypothetical protein